MAVTPPLCVQVCIQDARDPSTSLGAYSLLLHTHAGRSMLEFQVGMLGLNIETISNHGNTQGAVET